MRELDRVRQRLLTRDGFVSSSPANVAHMALDAVVDEYLPVMNKLSAKVDGKKSTGASERNECLRAA